MSDLSSTASEIRRTELAGVIWFAAERLAAALVVAGLLGNGWRVGMLPAIPLAAVVCGVVLVIAGLGATAWAGCPVLGPDLERADRQKTLCLRVGLVLYALGAVLGVGALLLR